MLQFLANLPTFIWFLIILSFFWGLGAFFYSLGSEVGAERGFKLGYARGKLVGTQEAHYLASLSDREGV